MMCCFKIIDYIFVRGNSIFSMRSLRHASILDTSSAHVRARAHTHARARGAPVYIYIRLKIIITLIREIKRSVSTIDVSVQSLRIKTDKTLLPSLLLVFKSRVPLAVLSTRIFDKMALVKNQYAKFVFVLFCCLSQVRP